MRVTVTPICRHADGWTSQGLPFVGSHVIVSRNGVILDGEHVIRRDRRAIVNREKGHPWVSEGVHPDPRYRTVVWTSFDIEVKP